MTHTPADKNAMPGRPLIKRYIDENGNQMISMAAWFYDEMVAGLDVNLAARAELEKVRDLATDISEKCSMHPAGIFEKKPRRIDPWETVKSHRKMAKEIIAILTAIIEKKGA